MNSPLISVIMAVKNGTEYIEQSIKSILNQTCRDFEFIIINDGSDDQTLDIISSFQDPRIKVFSQSNRGVARSANRGLSLAQGKFIARQDHDDFSKPERFELQVAYLNLHPEVALVGSAAEIWVRDEPTNRLLSHPEMSGELRLELLFNNPFVHSSVMFRREIIKRVGLYNPSPKITPLDDYDFISRVSFDYELANLKEALVVYRETPKSLTSGLRTTSSKDSSGLKEKLIFVSSRNIAKYNSNKVDNSDCRTLTSVMNHIDQDIKLWKSLKAKRLLKSTINLNRGQFSQPNRDISEVLQEKLDVFEYHALTLELERHLNLSGKIYFLLLAIHYRLLPSRRRELSRHYQTVLRNESSKIYWQVREFIYHRLFFEKFSKFFKSLRK